jgi:glycosyltransferase involved in cell wall biosynthesis
MTLTMVGDGPLKEKLQVVSDQRQAPVAFLPPVSGADKQKIFAEHDLLVLPSLTEISPNVALEARATGLPVLLTSETGLSEALRQGMIIAKLRTPEEIRAAIMDVRMRYPEVAKSAGQTFPERSWQTVAEEYIALFKRLA